MPIIETVTDERIFKTYLDRRSDVLAKLVGGDEKRKVFDFKPGNGTAVCIEGEGHEWSITWAWRQDHAAG